MPALLAAAFGACVSLPISPDSAQTTIDKVVSLQEPHGWLLWASNNGQLSNRQIGKSNLTECLRKEFDVARLLTVLPNLSMQSGQTLDYVYYSDPYGGWPVLYARNKTAIPFESYAALSNAMPGAETRGLIADVQSKGYGYYLDSIRADGSQEGYFQLIVLYLMGDQFFKFWHDCYHDEIIVCDTSGLDALFKDQNREGRLIPDEVCRSARELQLKPTVRITGDTALVAITIFTQWGGFQRRTFTIRRYPPHSIIDQKIEVLVECHCGGLI